MKWSPRESRILHRPVVHPTRRRAFSCLGPALILLLMLAAASPGLAVDVDDASGSAYQASRSESSRVGWPRIGGLALLSLAAALVARHALRRPERGEENPFTKPARRFFKSRPSGTAIIHASDSGVAPTQAQLTPSPSSPPEISRTPAAGPREAPSRSDLPPAQSFVHAAAHDLQEPLRKLKGQIHRIASQLEPSISESAQAELESMRKTATRMQLLLDSLLSLARIQGRSARFEPVNLSEVLRDAQSNLEPRLLETRAEVSFMITAPPIDADAVQILQLFQNLLSNALKFHVPGKPPRIQVSAQFETPTPAEAQAGVGGGNRSAKICEIRVQDDGIGFEASEWGGMLQGFHRQHGRQRFEGTGLGLAICRSIVERHSGSMTAVSRPGSGATVIVRLPTIQHSRSGDTTWIAPTSSPDPATDPEAVAPPTRSF
ncbi:MAG: HAMP domain-containing histidine kinase [Verrucomicrobia bacterium]|nr:HAMP domain-containing histidine kinase [Verrucomicrobiota bacterium]MBI3870675.1 HAMP domain-containing histidine kinase [Verrucomicrobiota bacterium]